MKTIIIWISTMLITIASLANSQFKTAAAMQKQFSTNEIVNGYLTIKNALVKSDSKATTQAGKALEVVLNTIDTSQLTAKQKLTLTTIIDEAKKQNKSIIANTGKLDKQRMAFQQLSKSVYDLVTTFGSDKKLYVDFCPMYEEGSIWLSESQNIKNPYYGAQMLTCGRIKETID